MREIRYIILHHSATGYQLNKEDTDGKQIGRVICEKAKKLWEDKYPSYKCDYHFLIGHTGKVFNGQPLTQAAWHATNFQVNLHSIAICFLGNFERIEMPIEQFNAGVKLIKDLIEQYDIPLKNILRHRDIISDITHHANSTLCPGKYFPFIEMLEAIGQKTEAQEAWKFVKENKIMQRPAGIDLETYLKSYINHQDLAVFLYRAYNIIKEAYNEEA